MERRKFSREFKVETVRLIKEQGISYAQARRDLDVHESVLRRWVSQADKVGVRAFPGRGRMQAPDAAQGRTVQPAPLHDGGSEGMRQRRQVLVDGARLVPRP